MLPAVSLPRSAFASLDAALSHEWLLTNGIGGFACGTVALANTRRYHGLLLAALAPPVDRHLLLAKVDAVASYRGRRYELACNEFADGSVSPQGFTHLTSFALDGQIPLWTYALGDALLEQRIWMTHGVNTVYVQFTLRHATAPLRLELTPLCTDRDYHALTRGDWNPVVTALGLHGNEDRGCTVQATNSAPCLWLLLDRGDFAVAAAWYWKFRHRVEIERGLDADEDLFRPGYGQALLQPGESLTLTASSETTAPAAPEIALRDELLRQQQLLQSLSPDAPLFVQRLTIASDAYIVRRGASGTSLIAGYPWFSDWGRDTMIALPGLTSYSGKLAEAAAVLRTFAAHVSEGMLPNRFPDGNDAPEYNTVDATLWYFHAIAHYIACSADHALLRELYPVLVDIIKWHRHGTRYGIVVDRADGLLRAGEPGVQLTWMDAKIGDWVVTPRSGKAVEINALWHYALEQMATWAPLVRDKRNAAGYARAAEQVAASFHAAFWYPDGGYLYDVVDTLEAPAHGQLNDQGQRVDSSLRPNQIIAVSLDADLVTGQRARSVVDAVGRALLTPVGLRSVAPEDSQYIARYQGGPRERDAAYHQGTVWSWLLGPYALAHFRAYGDAAHARALLEAGAAHLDQACIGQVSEIFDGAAPHAPRGCFAQAWGVAEWLRAWHELHRS